MQSNWKGTKLERFPAILGSNLTKNEVSPLCNMFCTDGMKGCFESHRRLWKKIINDNLLYALILEDDAFPLKHFEDKVSSILNELPSNWDVCSLHNIGFNFKHNIDYSDIPLEYIYKFLNVTKQESVQISKNLCIPYLTIQTCAYLISQRGARKLYSAFSKPSNHVDIKMFSLKNLNVYASNKSLVFHDMENSGMVEKSDFLKFTNEYKYKNIMPGTFAITEPFFEIAGLKINIKNILIYILILILLSLYYNKRKIFIYGTMILIIGFFIILKCLQVFN
jgi:GR25 family glycosyltransferase involved in LPS biosynthesis